jgi:hypothetical protein
MFLHSFCGLQTRNKGQPLNLLSKCLTIENYNMRKRLWEWEREGERVWEGVRVTCNFLPRVIWSTQREMQIIAHGQIRKGRWDIEKMLFIFDRKKIKVEVFVKLSGLIIVRNDIFNLVFFQISKMLLNTCW